MSYMEIRILELGRRCFWGGQIAAVILLVALLGFLGGFTLLLRSIYTVQGEEL